MDDDHDSHDDWFGRIRSATGFLTRLPVAGNVDEPLARATPAFPLVGAGVGLVAGLAFCLADWLGLGAWLAAVAAVLAAIVATGALHEDGVADVADGFGAHGDRERKLDAMRDSRIGAFGVIALVLVLAARIGVIAALAHPALVVGALIGAGALSRSYVVIAMRMMPLARQDGLGAGAGTPSFHESLAALLIAIAIGLAVLLTWSWLVAAVAGAAAAALMAWRANRSFGGQTGDVLGTIQQVSEVAILAGLVACLS